MSDIKIITPIIMNTAILCLIYSWYILLSHIFVYLFLYLKYASCRKNTVDFCFFTCFWKINQVWKPLLFDRNVQMLQFIIIVIVFISTNLLFLFITSNSINQNLFNIFYSLLIADVHSVHWWHAFLQFFEHLKNSLNILIKDTLWNLC